MGKALNQTTQMQCPHGGTVQIIPSQTRALIQGVPAATTADTFVIVGCTFVQGNVPSPCTSIQWLISDQRVALQGNRTLNEQSVGLCLSAAQVPQGNVIVQSTQSKVLTQ